MLQVGVGGFGETWLRALAGLPGDVELCGLVDRVPAALDAARALTGVPADRCHTDLEAALAAAEADVAVAVVPPAAHREVATRCLEAGLPVLLEKPLAGTREDCLALVETAQRLGRELAVSQNYRYRPRDRDGPAGDRVRAPGGDRPGAGRLPHPPRLPRDVPRVDGRTRSSSTWRSTTST